MKLEVAGLSDFSSVVIIIIIIIIIITVVVVLVVVITIVVVFSIFEYFFNCLIMIHIFNPNRYGLFN